MAAANEPFTAFVLVESHLLPNPLAMHSNNNVPTVGLEFDVCLASSPLQKLEFPSKPTWVQFCREVEVKLGVKNPRIRKWIWRDNGNWRPQRLFDSDAFATRGPSEESPFVIFLQDQTPSPSSDFFDYVYVLIKWLNPATKQFQFLGAAEVDLSMTIAQFAENIVLPLLPNKKQIKLSDLKLVDEERAAENKLHLLDPKKTLRIARLRTGDIICVSSDEKCDPVAALTSLVEHDKKRGVKVKTKGLDVEWLTATTPATFTLLSTSLDLSKLFDSQEFADLVFTFPDSTAEIYAHKALLSVGSEYFAIMFRSGFKEGKQSRGGVLPVELKDTNEKTFRLLVQHLYGQNAILRVAEDYELLSELLELAQRYLVPSLESTCLQLLESFISVNSCLRLLTLSNKLQLERLQDVALDFISARGMEISNLPEFLQLCKDRPDLMPLIVRAMAKHCKT